MGQWDLQQIFSFEAVFIAFLYAGIYKTHPALRWIPVDLTVLFLFISGTIVVLLWFQAEWEITPIVALFIIVYLIFIIYTASSTLWSNSNVYAQYKLTRLFTIVSGSIGGAIVISQSRKRFNRFLRLTVAFGTLLSMIIIIQFLLGNLQGGFQVGEVAYLLPSRVIAVSALIAVYWLSRARYFYAHLGLIILVGIQVISVFLSSSRGALITMFVAIGTYVVLQSWPDKYYMKITKEIKILVFSIIIGCVGIVVAIVSGLIDFSSFRIVQRTLRLYSPSQTETSLLARTEHYQFAFDLWTQSPFIGHGIGSYGVLRTGQDIISYPHNIILEVLAELGIFGFFLICLLVGIGLMRVFRYRAISDGPTNSFLIAFAFFWFVSALFSFDITGNRFFFMSLAFLCATNNVLIKDHRLADN